MLLKQEENSIELQTSLRTSIVNSQITTEISPIVQKQLESLKSKFVGVTYKSEPSSLYNCHGLTFANRRTGIYEIKEIKTILNDDKYKEINKQDILPGDIVMYYSESGDIEHSGIVLYIDKSIIPNDIKILSKWGSAYEAIHSLYSCPYELIYIKFYRCEL